MIAFFARRPAVVWAASVAVLLAGAIAFVRLPLATRSTVELPRLNIYAFWPGSAPEAVEAYLSAPIEGAVQGVRGVKSVSSRSSDESSSLVVDLEPDADVALTRLAILERLELLRGDVPPGAYAPTVSNYTPEGLEEQPLLSLVLTGPYTPGTLQRAIDERVSPRLSAVPGVSAVELRGGTTLGVAITYDGGLLRRIGVAPYTINEAVQSARIVQSLGALRAGGLERTVVLRDQPNAVADLLALPIRGPAGRIFRLGDVGTARAEEDSRGRFFRINGRPAVALDVTRLPGADAIRTARALRGAVRELQPSLPAGIRLAITGDESVELARELRDLALRGALALGAVCVVLAVMLRRARAVALVLFATLVAIAGTALVLYVLHIPANLLTLAGLGMGIGILVQNPLVVVQRLGAGNDAAEVRAAAASRIMPAVVGSTLATGVVLFPFLYLQGNARAAFVPFASAFSLALAWSVITALFVVPALGGGITTRTVRWRRMRRGYARTLALLLRLRPLTIACAVATLGVLTWAFVVKVPRSSFSGWGEQRTTLSVYLSFPRGSDPGSVDVTMREFERIVARRPEVEETRVQAYSPTRADMLVRFTRDGGYTSVPLELQELLTQRAVLVGGASISVHGQGPGFSSGGMGGGSSTFRLAIKGYSYDGVGRIADDLKKRLENFTRVRDVRITSGAYYGSERGYEVTIQPDRAAMARFGVDAMSLSRAVSREIRGASQTQPLEIDGDEMNVSVKDAGARDRSMRELTDAIVPTTSGAPVHIGDLSVVSEREALSAVIREDQQYVRNLSYDFRGPPKLAQRTHKAFMGALGVPAGYAVQDLSNDFGFREDDSTRGLYYVFALGIALVILAVALTFDSVWGASMTFLSLPLCLGGVVAAFWALGSAFTREAAVGVILVVGLAVNHAILLVDAALAKRRARTDHGASPGLARGDVLRASLDRAGMIVVVTLASLASLAPLSLGTKTSDLFGAIALATAGGTFAGTVGALFVLPVLMLGWQRSRRVRGAPADPATGDADGAIAFAPPGNSSYAPPL